MKVALRRLALATAVGFVLAVTANPSTGDIAVAGLCAIVLTFAVAIARRVDLSRAAMIVAALTGWVALWLLPQRDDLGTALVCAALVGVSTSILGGRLAVRTRASVPAGVAVVAIVVLRITASQAAVLLACAGCLAAALVGAFVEHRAIGARSAPRRILVALLVIVTVVFSGYVGAETPDATWFGGGITHGPRNTPTVALTFDDGPNIGATQQIMTILDSHGVRGTFFEVGKAIDAEPQITRQLYAHGHLLGNHSYHHDDWRWLDPRYPELQRTQDAFERAVGVCPTFFRPPHGERTPLLARVVHDHDMHMVLWNVSAADWTTTNPQAVARRIVRGARPGAILLLHDGLDGNPRANRDVVVRALPLILDGLAAKGLRAVGLDQLLSQVGYQPCRRA